MNHGSKKCYKRFVTKVVVAFAFMTGFVRGRGEPVSVGAVPLGRSRCKAEHCQGQGVVWPLTAHRRSSSMHRAGRAETGTGGLSLWVGPGREGW